LEMLLNIFEVGVEVVVGVEVEVLIGAVHIPILAVQYMWAASLP